MRTLPVKASSGLTEAARSLGRRIGGDGLLDEQSVSSASEFSAVRVDFDAVRAFKLPLLREAFSRFRRGAASFLQPEFEAFQQQSAVWLPDFALFMAIKETRGGEPWSDWPA